jgi:hypothetical protein
VSANEGVFFFFFFSILGSTESRFFVNVLSLLVTAGSFVRLARCKRLRRLRRRASSEYALCCPVVPLLLGFDALKLRDDRGPYMLLFELLFSFIPERPLLPFKLLNPEMFVDIYFIFRV